MPFKKSKNANILSGSPVLLNKNSKQLSESHLGWPMRRLATFGLASFIFNTSLTFKWTKSELRIIAAIFLNSSFVILWSFEWNLSILSPERQKIFSWNQRTKTEFQNVKTIDENIDIWIWTYNKTFRGHSWVHFKIFTFKIGQELAKRWTIF